MYRNGSITLAVLALFVFLTAGCASKEAAAFRNAKAEEWATLSGNNAKKVEDALAWAFEEKCNKAFEQLTTNYEAARQRLVDGGDTDVTKYENLYRDYMQAQSKLAGDLRTEGERLFGIVAESKLNAKAILGINQMANTEARIQQETFEQLTGETVYKLIDSLIAKAAANNQPDTTTRPVVAATTETEVTQ